jgi:hypothetical protein
MKNWTARRMEKTDSSAALRNDNKKQATVTADPLSGMTTRKTRAAAKAKAEQQIPPLRWNSRSSAALRNDNKRSATARAHATISGDGLKVQVWAWAAVG